MNSNWKNFLLTRQAVFADDDTIVFPTVNLKNNRHIYPLAHLAVLMVRGHDAAKFLQGQITCNINDLTENKSSLGAMCNPKGRVITMFLLVKNGDHFLMVLPKELLALVKKKLQMYVLRADVCLSDSSEDLILIGLDNREAQVGLDFTTTHQQYITINFQNRSLIIADADNAQAFWEEQVNRGFQPDDSAQWRYLDLLSGIPWLSLETSEAFIPQMLNLDKLAAISFNKGCYTGQEIVARTHFLGKNKREMFLAECDMEEAPKANLSIVDGHDTELSVGKVLYAQIRHQMCKMLVVLQISDINTDNLKLKNPNRDKITLLTL